MAKLENRQQMPIASLCSPDGRNESEFKNALIGLCGADPSVAIKGGTTDTTAATKVSRSYWQNARRVCQGEGEHICSVPHTFPKQLLQPSLQVLAGWVQVCLAVFTLFSWPVTPNSSKQLHSLLQSKTYWWTCMGVTSPLPPPAPHPSNNSKESPFRLHCYQTPVTAARGGWILSL